MNRFILLIIILSGSPWIIKIALVNPVILILIILLSLIIYLSLLKFRKKVFIFSLFVLLLLSFFQYKLTQYESLTEIGNDDRRLIDMRLIEYPPVYIKLLGKTLWIPAPHWLEQRKESIALRRIKRNIFENLDINQYFFAGHPTERVGVKEFEKFPYFYLLFFIVGIYFLVEKKKVYITLPFLLIPLVLISLIGNKNDLGPFIFIPFFISIITVGFEKIITFLKKENVYLRIFLIIFCLLVYAQIIIYEFI